MRPYGYDYLLQIQTLIDAHHKKEDVLRTIANDIVIWADKEVVCEKWKTFFAMEKEFALQCDALIEKMGINKEP